MSQELLVARSAYSEKKTDSSSRHRTNALLWPQFTLKSICKLFSTMNYVISPESPNLFSYRRKRKDNDDSRQFQFFKTLSSSSCSKKNLLFCSAFLFIRSAAPLKQAMHVVFLILFLSQILTANSYVFTREGKRQSFLQRRLIGRQRREAEKEILSILGLNHRPRPHNPREVETSSAPLYMLGLYSTASHVSDPELGLDVASDGLVDSRFARLNRMPTSVGNPQSDRELAAHIAMNSGDFQQRAAATSLRRYIDDSGILTNEIGVFESAFRAGNPPGTDIAMESERFGSAPIERRLVDQSDMIISFINTRQQHDEFSAASSELRTLLRRHRSYFFDVTQTSRDDRLAAARFRLYKERSDAVLGNLTLRVNVYQVVAGNDASASVRLLGSRRVGSHQEGWIVYDVTSALFDWIRMPRSNQGLKVTVETLQGRYLKPAKSGLVGRRGSSTKQAFIVAFFNQDQPDLLRRNVRRRARRTASLNTDERNPASDDDEHTNASDARSGNETNATHDNQTSSNRSSSDELDRVDVDGDANTSSASQSSGARTMAKRKVKGKRKKKRKKKPAKNSSKRKTMEHCQRKQFYVDFKDLGWHTWIIAPKAYKAYQCYGKCSFPLNAGLNATNHAIVQSMVHVRLQQLDIPEPCCAPSKLEPLEILFFNDQTKVIYKKYRDMVVSACGCH